MFSYAVLSAPYPQWYPSQPSPAVTFSNVSYVSQLLHQHAPSPTSYISTFDPPPPPHLAPPPPCFSPPPYTSTCSAAGPSSYQRNDVQSLPPPKRFCCTNCGDLEHPTWVCPHTDRCQSPDCPIPRAHSRYLHGLLRVPPEPSIDSSSCSPSDSESGSTSCTSLEDHEASPQQLRPETPERSRPRRRRRCQRGSNNKRPTSGDFRHSPLYGRFRLIFDDSDHELESDPPHPVQSNLKHSTSSDDGCPTIGASLPE